MSVRSIHRTLSSLTPQQRALFARRLAEDGLSGDSLEILPRPATDEPVPTSLMQQRLWILDQMEPGNPFYNLPLLCFRLRGTLRRDVLDRAFREIERRHEGLRTVFAPGDPVPLQVVLPAASEGQRELPLVDLSSLPAERAEETAWTLAREEGRWLFDLARGPLWRTNLVRIAPDDHLLFVLMHHIISDAWSLGVFYRELTTLYSTFLRGLPSPLPEPPIQFPDFAIWQRSQLQGERLDEEVRFWREQLAGAPDLLELPWDRPRPPQRTFDGERLTARFSPELAEAVAGLSATAGASLFIVLLAAFDALLHRWSGQDDIVLGFPVAGRTLPTEGLIGFFVNTVALRVRLGGDPSFRELLARTRNVVLDIFEHQELPFDRLVEELNPRRDPAWSPVFQVMMSLQNTPTPDLDLPGLEVTHYGVSSGTAQTDLIFFAGMERGRLSLLHLEYNTGLFDTATMQRMEGHLLRLLAGAAADPDLPLSCLPLLSAAEAHQLYAEWGGGDAPGEAPLSGMCVHDVFAAQARQWPDETAVTCEGVSWTYQELERRANALAHHLAALGVRPGDRVGLCIEPGLAMITALFGILKAGGAYVPLDPAYPAERMAFLLEDALGGLGGQESPLVLAGPGLAGRIPPGHAAVVELDDRLLASEADDPPPVSVLPGFPAYVIYTSGSTGRPKGVVNTHANLVRFLESALPVLGLVPGDVWCLFHAFTFDFSVWEIFGALLSGGRLVIFPRNVARSPQNLLRSLAASGVTVLNQTPAALYQLVAAAAEETVPAPLSLRLVIAGGEALDTGRLAPWLPGKPRLVNVYGITETTVLSTSRSSDWRDPAIGRRIGRPLPGIALHVLGRHGERVPIGVPGEICLGGQGVARGYLGRLDLTTARFVPDPFTAVPGSRLYRSGDLARLLPDGDIEFLGRIDHQVKLRGFRIELGEIEASLARHPGVRDCVAAVRATGSGDPGIVAWYVPVIMGSTPEPEPAELRAFLLQSLPEHMVPAVFMPLAALPWTSSGKVDRKALPAPERTGARRGAEPSAPRTPLEETLVELWKELLGVAQVDRDDDFFELGGHSLVATRLTSRLRDRLQVEVPPQLVFQNPRLAALADALERVRERGSRPEAPALTALPRRVRRAG